MKRRIVFVFALAGLATAAFYGCKKMTENHDLPVDMFKSKDIVQMNNWLEKQKAIATGEDIARIKNIQENLDINKSWTEEFTKGEHFMAIPLLQGFKSSNNPDKACKAVLLLFVGDTGIRRANVVQYYNSKQPVSLKEGTFGKLFTSKEPDFSGTLSFSTITDSRAFDLSYEKGKMVSYSKPMFKTNKSGNGRIDECYARYLVTYYSDGTEDWQYLYTWCKVTDDCNTTRVVNGVALKSGLFCGEGGGTGTPPADCCMPDADIAIGIESASNELPMKEGIVGTEADGSKVKTNLYSWEYLSNSAGWYKWSYVSFEKGVVTDKSGVWRFKSFEHVSEGMTGQLPPCMSFSGTIKNYSIQFYDNNRSVAMSIQWMETFTLCFPGAQPTYTYGNSFHDFQAS